MSQEKAQLYDALEAEKRYDLHLECKNQLTDILTLGFYFKPQNAVCDIADLQIDDLKEAKLEYRGDKNIIGSKSSLQYDNAIENGVGDNNIPELDGPSAEAIVLRGIVGSGSVADNNIDEYLLQFHHDRFELIRVETSVRNLRPVRDESFRLPNQPAELNNRSVSKALKLLKGKKRKVQVASSVENTKIPRSPRPSETPEGAEPSRNIDFLH